MEFWGRVWAYDLLSRGNLRNCDFFAFFLESLNFETSYFVQACIIFNIQRWEVYTHSPKENNKFKSLAQLAAAVLLVRSGRGISGPSFLNILVDSVTHTHKVLQDFLHLKWEPSRS
eukprot:Phypoly_transcript_23040.p1 GENE.Phypoly_transcript_23040~~Phypoly_transcript_23040.p1  ORF type:complete len:116 (+),score=7.09 Phypoly_transcript_23040:85-432(+)